MERNKLLIEKLLDDNYGSRSELARVLGVLPSTVHAYFGKWRGKKEMSIRMKKIYTKGFNEMMGTTYTHQELFSPVENSLKNNE